MIKTVVLVLIAGLLGGTGHVLLSKGMKTVGDLHTHLQRTGSADVSVLAHH